MKKRGGHKRGIEARKRLTGRLFVLPWEIGILLFVLIPILRSIWLAFGTVSMENGLQVEFTGLAHFDYIFNQDPNYYKNVLSAISNFAYTLPLVVVMSLIFALLLNKKFRGRLFFRAVFFSPVIIVTGVVYKFLTADTAGQALLIGAEGSNPYAAGAIDFERILLGFNLPDTVTELLSVYIGMIFNLVWSCGIPIVLFIAALQTIPSQLYEASRVEGATAWEEFWFITFPSIGNMLMLVVIYVMLDILTASTNPVMSQAYDLMTKQQIYDESSAMLLAYFAIIGVLIAAILLLVDRLMLKRWR